MGRVRSLFALFVLALVLTTAGLAHATVVVPLSVEQQVAQADLVVRARVVAMQSAFVPERGHFLSRIEISSSPPRATMNTTMPERKWKVDTSFSASPTANSCPNTAEAAMRRKMRAMFATMASGRLHRKRTHRFHTTRWR